MYCSHCGKEIKDTSIYCPYCNESTQVNGDKKANIGLKVLSFLMPSLGAIFYLCFEADTPTRSKQCGRCALYGFFFYLVLLFFGIIIIKGLIRNFINQLLEQIAALFSYLQ